MWRAGFQTGLLKDLRRQERALPCLPRHTYNGFASQHRRDATDSPAALEGSKQHWLDLYFPGVRQWLDGQNRRWWLWTMRARCRQYVQLQGREEMISRLIEAKYQATLSKHASKIMDERAETHLQVAALVLATHKVMGQWIKDEKEMMKILRLQGGGSTNTALNLLLRFSLWLARDPFTTGVRRLRALSLDLGSAFDSSVHASAQVEEAELKIKRCLYEEVFKADDAPQLLACCCCSQDMAWFVGLERHGLALRRIAWKGSGQACCKLRLERT